jgi:hypothetical protein
LTDHGEGAASPDMTAKALIQIDFDQLLLPDLSAFLQRMPLSARPGLKRFPVPSSPLVATKGYGHGSQEMAG